ncbi:hypothetical protein [Mycobacterium haemophilum]|uniref:Secreted protein n=1 Tax=Mycobacterium haemophilum TaxID=29311 RepID=A0A0I9YX80_9MYCO|nr:hypothetical protein [Mycobacterium haemophilum]AKN18475.1 hypothetical protein B586_04925 [Mycobacterium haemophilum DSM 44634]KLO26816.1 hypothetical protein ABH39_17125 [Mycobacterium haemophilum]KLO38680.1 hypothetical protein ABH38_02955 [Mycobacterium haemophilum]KLO44997.1 hypothetical protein ABH37_01845 [Mycobacterium haemophilum]KLO56341.1 hypothetical protein ABH36_01830 [Mycobacterium haemophilum]
MRRGLAAGAGILSAIALGIALQSADPASAVGPPPDGNYNFNQAGVSGVTWTITALCDQPSGTRNQADYSDPVTWAFQCALNVASQTPEQITRADRLQNFSARARLASVLWTFQVNQPEGVSCPDGSTAPSTETYSFDDATLAGTHTTLHGAVCGLQPEMSKQPFSLQLVGPPPSPVQRYPLYCNNIAMCY